MGTFGPILGDEDMTVSRMVLCLPNIHPSLFSREDRQAIVKCSRMRKKKPQKHRAPCKGLRKGLSREETLELGPE